MEKPAIYYDLLRFSRRLRLLTNLVLAAVVLLGVVPYLAAAIRAGFAAPVPTIGRGPEALRVLALGTLQCLSAAFYVWGLWTIGRIFKAIGDGVTFAPAIAAGVGRIGWALVGGALTSIVVYPNLRRWEHDVGILKGDAPAFSGLLHYDVAYIAIGVVGLALVLLGRLLRQAVALEARAGALEAELNEFV